MIKLILRKTLIKKIKPIIIESIQFKIPKIIEIIGNAGTGKSSFLSVLNEQLLFDFFKLTIIKINANNSVNIFDKIIEKLIPLQIHIDKNIVFNNWKFF